jgi:glucosamine-6-phosphate deaminase
MNSEAEQFEKIPTAVYQTSEDACRVLAAEVASLMRQKDSESKCSVLGFATGSTPVPFYRELIRLHREEGLSFKNVITFNLDEYFGLEPQHRESYYRFMREQLFDHIDLPDSQINIPPGTVSRGQVYAACQDYESKIESAGGIDLQILGIGRTGHIGFNEPGSSQDSPTRMITLDKITREDAARDFLGMENVPRFALTMGVGTIMRARRLALMAWGENKADIVAKAVEGPVTDVISASFLQNHPNAQFLLDRGASQSLTRVRHPWLVGSVKWNDAHTRRGVTWLSNKLQQPILKLLDEHYNEHGMSDLLTDCGPAYQLNIRIFNELQHTISGWPGGKPDEDDRYRPERALPFPKHSLILSPEPSDEIRAVGGTINRLIEQGHTVDVVFLTSGNLSIGDDAAEYFADVLQELAAQQPASAWQEPIAYAGQLLADLEKKGPFGEDTQALRTLKGLVRRGEARHALRACGLSANRIHFLDLPFYETGRYRRFQPGETDVTALKECLSKFSPHQIYMTGSASDPSSVPGVCFGVFKQALEKAALNDCCTWLYRSSEKPLQSYEIEMAVPMSPDQLKSKLAALSQYTQENESTGKRDQAIACYYDQLGLANYEAIEAFQEWRETSPSELG